ncbi:interferon-induced GTP-binding protein Mx-like [Conger conger]|uniref:interferon-induced GTP-binding protein Mx-like n=1 Tax=Conger conger TaxID=82655 RepID=UPI002A5A2498|nr:interferon-induced GTP-binding protein Mx-like [Conger conger]
MSLDQHYEEKVRPCIDLIDTLRSLGVEEDLALPAIAVIGDQSSGKGSVLEALSGVALPRGSGIVTRCPLILKLKKVKRDQPWAGVLTYKVNNKACKSTLKTPEEVGRVVADVQVLVAGKGEGISNEMIALEIKSADVPDLTLIDLPGIARVAVGNQPKDIGNQVRGEIGIEAVKLVMDMILKGDGEDEDDVQVDEDKLGNNVSQDVIDQDLEDSWSVSEAKRHDQLMDNQKATIPYLAERLTKELVEHIAKSLPKLEEQIDKKLEQTNGELKNLGDGVPQDQGQMTNFLIEKITKFNSLLLEVARAEEVVEEGNTRVFTKIRSEFSKWKAQLDKKANKLNQRIEEQVHEYEVKHRGRELPGFINYKTFEILVKDHLKKLEEPVVKKLKGVTACSKRRGGVNNVVYTQDSTYSHNLDDIRMKEQDEQHVAVAGSAFPTVPEHKTRSLVYSTDSNATLQEMMVHLKSYYHVADQVPPVIRYLMLQESAAQLQREMLQMLQDKENAELLLKEDYYIGSKRAALQSRLKRLTEARNYLMKF